MLAVLLLVAGAEPGPTFQVENKIPAALTVTNRMPAPAVAAPRPFPSSGVTTRATTAPPAAGLSTASAATVRTAGITTLAPRVTRGSTRCAT